MALDSSMTLNVSNLAAYIATADTAAPPLDPTTLAAFDFDVATLATGWEQIGHTSQGTDVTITSSIEGGETLGSLQRAALRRTPLRATYSIGIAALQLDNRVLSLYFGGGNSADPDYFGLPKQFQVQQRALVLVMADSEANAAWYFGKTELQPNGDIAFGPSALSEAGLTASILDSDGSTDLGGLFRAGLGTPV